MKRFLWDHAIPQQVHTPSSFGPAVILKTTDTWVSSLKWPGYCNSWNTQVIIAETAQIKWRPNPPTTKVYKFIFTCFAFIVFEKSEFWFPEAAKAPAWFLSLVAEVKWQFRDWNDSLTLSPVSQPYRFDPEGSQQNLAESKAPSTNLVACVDSWLCLLESKCNFEAKVADPWLTVYLCSDAWECRHWCWLCNQLFILK